MIVETFMCDVFRDCLLLFALSFPSISLARLLHMATKHSMKYIIWSELLKYLFVYFMFIAKLKKYKSPGSDQIPAELIQAGGETFQSEIHKLINSIWSKE
jgi:hypothetical protein